MRYRMWTRVWNHQFTSQRSAAKTSAVQGGGHPIAKAECLAETRFCLLAILTKWSEVNAQLSEPTEEHKTCVCRRDAGMQQGPAISILALDGTQSSMTAKINKVPTMCPVVSTLNQQ